MKVGVRELEEEIKLSSKGYMEFQKNEEVKRLKSTIDELLWDRKKINTENEKLKSALSITLDFYSEFAEDEEDEMFIEECKKLIKRGEKKDDL